MKKKINFEKQIHFPTMIGVISAISLEQDLRFVDSNNIEGNLLLTGKYKLTEASRLEEDFDYKIPVEIAVVENLDLNTCKISISDFYYEIVEDDVMVCHIELSLEGLEMIEDETDLVNDSGDVVRECDSEVVPEEEKEIPKMEVIEEETTPLDEDDLSDSLNDMEESLFFPLDDHDTYGTFVVYIVRQNETIQTILEKYPTTLEEVEKYNDLKQLAIGTKLIIPLLHD